VRLGISPKKKVQVCAQDSGAKAAKELELVGSEK